MASKTLALEPRVRGLVARALAAAGSPPDRATAARQTRLRLRRAGLIRSGVRPETVERHVREALSEQSACEKTGRRDGPDDVGAVLERLFARKLIVSPKG